MDQGKGHYLLAAASMAETGDCEFWGSWRYEYAHDGAHYNHVHVVLPQCRSVG